MLHLRLLGINGKEQEASAGIVRKLTLPERLTRAITRAGLFFGLAVICILVPVFHFVLVPSFILLSLVMGVVEFKKDKVAYQKAIHCPNCAKIVELKVYFNDYPARKKCHMCREDFWIENLRN